MRESFLVATLALCLLVHGARPQIMSFQMVANPKTNACLTEWFGDDETLAVTFNMDEHLTQVLRGEKRRARQENEHV